MEEGGNESILCDTSILKTKDNEQYTQRNKNDFEQYKYKSQCFT